MPAAAAPSSTGSGSGAAADQHRIQLGQRGRGGRDRPVPWRVGRPPARRSGGRIPSRPRRRAARRCRSRATHRSRPEPCRPARCGSAPAVRRCDRRAGRAARCRCRRGGHGWPTRWRSARGAVSIAPLGVPVVPEVDTTSATSSSISSPARNAVVSSSVWRGSPPGTGSTGRVAAVEHAFQGGQHRQRRRARPGRRARAGWLFGVLARWHRRPRGRRPAASRWRPDRSRTRSTSSGNGNSSVIWVISTPMSTWSNSPRSMQFLHHDRAPRHWSAGGTATRTAAPGRGRARRRGSRRSPTATILLMNPLTASTSAQRLSRQP